MSKEVAKKETEIVTSAVPMGVVDFMDDLTASDVERENILLMQKLSGLLDECDAKPGQFIRTDTKEVIGGAEASPAKVVIIKGYKNWRKKVVGSKQSVGTVPFEPGVELYSVTGTTEDGKQYVHQLQFNYLVLLASDIYALPFVLTLRSKGIPAAKRINSIVSAMQRLGASPWDKVIELYSVEEENEDGKFYVAKARVGEDTNAETRLMAANWKQTLADTRITSKADISADDESSNNDDDIPF